ncbi:MAG: hypothetical protein Q7T78_09460 [Rhodoferax sp.]|nr:hypothetical protein [Rhodoferax sp.]
MNIKSPLPLDASRQSAFTTPIRLLLATTAAFWMGTAQPQVCTTTVARPFSELRFRNFFATPAEESKLEISDTLRQADGQAVRLVGYMVQQRNPTPGRFLLAPRPVLLGEDAHEGADVLPPATVEVKLDPQQQDWAVPHVSGLVTVNGKLSLHPHQESDDQVSSVCLQLDHEAARSMNAFELTGYLHRRQSRPG